MFPHLTLSPAALWSTTKDAAHGALKYARRHQRVDTNLPQREFALAGSGECFPTVVSDAAEAFLIPE